MKFNPKFLLAGIILPASYLTFFASTQTIETRPADVALARPYVVEVHSERGDISGQFSGSSKSADPFVIATELGANPHKEDKFSAFPEIKMRIGSKITIYEAPKYTVIDGKKRLEFRSWATTVSGLLRENNIDIGDDDKINFSADTNLDLGMQINIIRVAITNIHISQNIDFNIVRKEDKTLDKGKTKIQQAGQAGTKVLTYQLRREDGVEVARKLINTETTVQPVDEIQIIGTKPVITGWCRFNDLVLDASIKNGLDPDKLCNLMHVESNGHQDSSGQGGAHQGLFQYDPNFWADASAKAGYSGADVWDAKSQIYVTAWALTHGYQNRW